MVAGVGMQRHGRAQTAGSRILRSPWSFVDAGSTFRPLSGRRKWVQNRAAAPVGRQKARPDPALRVTPRFARFAGERGRYSASG